MKNYKKIAVLGGGGRTGHFLVRQLIEKGYSLKLLLRHPESFTIQHPSIEIIKGDALDPASIRLLLSGCDAVISTIGQRKDEPLMACRASVNVLKAMEEEGINRYILLAGVNVDTPFDKKGPETLAATEWMKTTFPLIHEDRQKSYAVLSESTADWTLVRVPVIEFTDDRPEIIVDLEDCKGAKISATNIAAFMIGQLNDPAYVRRSPFIANV